MHSLNFLHLIDRLPTISRQSFANIYNGRATLIVGIALFALGCLVTTCSYVYRSCLNAKKITPWNAEHKQALKDFAAQKLLKKEDQDILISQLENEETQTRLRQDPRSSLAQLEKAMLLEKKIKEVPHNLIVKYAMQAGPFLTKLDLQEIGAFITDQDFENICKHCPNLEELYLRSYTCLKGTFIAKLPQKLKRLELMDCQWVTDEHIAQLPSTLEVLNLYRCKNVRFSKAFPSNLQSLNLSECPSLTDENLAILLPCSHLKSLNLSYTNVTTVHRLPTQVESLILSGCQRLKDEALEHLSSTIKFLDLGACSITDKAITKLPVFLEFLNVAGCINLTNGAFVAPLPVTLKTLVLAGCRQLTDAALAPLSANMTLETLSLGYCEGLTNVALAKLPPHLKSLQLYGCSQFKNSALACLPAHLKSLNLTWCFGLTDGALDHLPAALESLNLSACYFTVAALAALPSNLQSFVACSGLTKDLFAKLPPSVKFLDLSECRLWSPAVDLTRLPPCLEDLRIPFQLTEQAMSQLRQKGVKVDHSRLTWVESFVAADCGLTPRAVFSSAP